MPRLTDSIIPLYRRMPDGLPEQYASGTLLKFGEVGFLATAAHCLDSVGEQGVFVPARSEVTAVEGRGSRCADPFDLGYLRLSDALTRLLDQSAYFLSSAEIDPDDQPMPNAHYMFVGFPWRQTRRLFGPKRFLQRTHAFTGKSYPPDWLVTEKLDPRIHIAVEFDRARVKTQEGVEQTAPMPQGMSGGAVFNVRRRPDPKQPVALRLAALGTFEGSHYLQGVRIAALLHLIREENSDIADLVSVSRRYVFGRSTPVP